MTVHSDKYFNLLHDCYTDLFNTYYSTFNNGAFRERYLIRSLDRFNPFLIKAKDYLVHASDFFYYMIQHNIQTSHGADVNQMA